MTKKVRRKVCRLIESVGLQFVDEGGMPEVLGIRYAKPLMYGSLDVFVFENRVFVRFTNLEYGKKLVSTKRWLKECCNEVSGKATFWVVGSMIEEQVNFTINFLKEVVAADLVEKEIRH